VEGAAGETVTPDVTVTFTVAVFPSESVTVTTSVTLPVAPAVYEPVPGSMLPPEGLAVSAKAKPVPLPPVAEKVRVPRGGVLLGFGLMLIPLPTFTVAEALFPRESVTVTRSVTPPVLPAV
jgi:hypothetical protein